MPHTKLHDAIADACALAESAVERNIEGRAAAVVKLLQNPDTRDEDIWRRAFDAAHEDGAKLSKNLSNALIEAIPSELLDELYAALGAGLSGDDWADDFGELNDIPNESRGFGWMKAWTVAISAAQAQYDAEHILPTLWKALQEGGLAVMDAAGSVPRPLSAEAKRGPGKAKFDAAKQRRGTT